MRFRRTAMAPPHHRCSSRIQKNTPGSIELDAPSVRAKAWDHHPHNVTTRHSLPTSELPVGPVGSLVRHFRSQEGRAASLSGASSRESGRLARWTKATRLFFRRALARDYSLSPAVQPRRCSSVGCQAPLSLLMAVSRQDKRGVPHKSSRTSDSRHRHSSGVIGSSVDPLPSSTP
jgi:hypothetical protein